MGTLRRSVNSTENSADYVTKCQNYKNETDQGGGTEPSWGLALGICRCFKRGSVKGQKIMWGVENCPKGAAEPEGTLTTARRWTRVQNMSAVLQQGLHVAVGFSQRHIVL